MKPLFVMGQGNLHGLANSSHSGVRKTCKGHCKERNFCQIALILSMREIAFILSM